MDKQIAPLITIVMPTFNHGKYLSRAIQSVIDQSYTNWELIIIDNYSTDETGDVILSFTDNRISYLKFHNNGVIGASRNIGIKVAKGEWVAFLDSDDWWQTDKLKEFHRQIGKNLDVFYHELEIVSPKKSWKRRLIGARQVKPPVQIDLLLRGNALATSSVVVRREILNRTTLFNESRSMIACEDYNLWLTLAGLTNNFYYCQRVLGYYMDDGNGISNRDMSEATQHAIASFLHHLNSSQRKYVEAITFYKKIRYAYIGENYKFVICSVHKTISKGPILNRIKSITLFFLSVVKIMRII